MREEKAKQEGTAYAETGLAPVVEGMDTAQQISILPPGQKGSKQKPSCLMQRIKDWRDNWNWKDELSQRDPLS